MLRSVPFGVVTWILPRVAPNGTVVVMAVCERMVKALGAPLKVTLVVPIRSVPRIVIVSPALPKEGRVFTKGPSPTDTWKTVPQPYDRQSSLSPPSEVVP